MSEALIVRRGGSGGAGGMNFSVKKYSSTPTGTAAENTIGVVTDTAISRWVMQAEQPTGTAGLVWIQVAAASDVAFYADSKEMVKLYPVAVKQYTGSAWKNAEAYVYQNGAWVIFSQAKFYLYNKGDECSSVSGGWQSYSYTGQDDYSSGSFTKKSGSILLSTDADDFRNNIMCRTKNKINVSNYSKISINVSARSGYANKDYEGCFMFLHSGTSTDTDASSATIKVGITKAGTFSINLSNTSGSYYVRIECYGATVEFTEVWLDE